MKLHDGDQHDGLNILPRGFVVLADSAFSIHRTVLPCYRRVDLISAEREAFNNSHKKIRIDVE